MALAGQIAEIWILYVLGVLMIAARIFCRTKMVGYKNYEWDDYFVIGVAFMWTAAPVIGHVFVQVAEGRHTSDLTFQERKNLSESERKDWAFGSQMFLLGLTGYFFILWTLKFNMLCFYHRVVRGLWTEIFIKPLMVFVALSGVAIILTIALTCRPFHHLWQVWPDPGRQCEPQNLVFFVVILTFNLVTDVCVMLVPIPVLRGIQINRWKKCGLYFLFSLGFFCMFAAILRFVLIFNLNQRGVSALWSMREDCVGIFVGQAPMVTPLFKRRFWSQVSYATSSAGFSNGHTRDYYYQNRDEGHELASRAAADSSNPRVPCSAGRLGPRSDSQEEIVRKPTGSETPPRHPKFLSGILVHQRIDIEGREGTYRHTDPRW
ncbi:uncharacterized protein NECHADRAFT_56504 [Fusarium vanettenii 77-13-4]|uniref:Rhodopsin domain-containing protein n=1 Tax=Fusarium vanettenii (strain ATCC MYA-4622 / CBS 123669 / FGSC 9596 / NRRL 45880 / 77-13-4) TaxID=660122 RepID=C7ZR11_FUSV7|nr:uncharacterized protein NECHADRAFT_56504 [Fusarium vanettenii 77-13-4]EEU33546.1 hypothetical protein NECHADRAFT_56504 [Fusarium vanettenii 77-13-4]